MQLTLLSCAVLDNIKRNVAMNIFYGFSRSNVDNAAHIGGFLVGSALTMVLGPQVSFRSSKIYPGRNVLAVSNRFTWRRLTRLLGIRRVRGKGMGNRPPLPT